MKKQNKHQHQRVSLKKETIRQIDTLGMIVGGVDDAKPTSLQETRQQGCTTDPL